MATLALVVCASSQRVDAQGMKVKKLEGWGTVTDPGDDCEFEVTEETLKITVPATNHDLIQQGEQKAPRVLQRVNGEFTVQVKVTAELNPGMRSVGVGRPYYGAGILIWQNNRNYVRIERNAYWIDPQTLNCYPPQIAYFRAGQPIPAASTEPTKADFFSGKSTWLKVRRQGINMFVSLSHDGQQWTDIKRFQVNLPDQLSVGVVAVNTSSEPLQAEFEGFSIVTPKK